MSGVSGEEDSDDETEQLMRELEKIKKERAAEEEKKEAERLAKEEKDRSEAILMGNPLLSAGEPKPECVIPLQGWCVEWGF